MRTPLVCLLAALLFSFCPGCGGDPTVDASSEETMKTSMEKVKQSLPESDRDKFDHAVATLMMQNLLSPGEFKNEEDAKKKMMGTLNGKTGKQIIAEADKASEETKKQLQELGKE